MVKSSSVINMKKSKVLSPIPSRESKSLLQRIKVAANKIAIIFTIFKGKSKKDSRSGDEAYSYGYQTSSQTARSSFGFSTGSRSRGSSPFKRSVSHSSSTTSATGQVLNLSMADIRKTTTDFSAENIIGEGGLGTVYKGQLRDGSLVAIKRAKKVLTENRLTAEFKNEILVLSKIEHLNLVRLYGYLEQEEERIIVFEYVGNGTLRQHLDGTRGDGLEFAERLDIAIDVAHAITYLHTYTDPPVIHRDIKASNVLITEKLRAKVADFGFARLVPEDQVATHISTQVKGTAGYLDPEYLKTYQLTEKSDVYSFGILLVELVTGRHPIEPTKRLKERMTARWAMRKLKEGEPVLAMDPRLRRTPASIIAVKKILKLAQKCLFPTKQLRPTMKKCGEELWAIRTQFREDQAGFKNSAIYHSVDIIERDATTSGQLSSGTEKSDSLFFVSECQ
ncbi:hypothetical protein Ancab_011529 [Ancistrocladus abbreviatus]